MPNDYWLPDGVYDETQWSIDSIYLYVITDGSVGGPTPGGVRVATPSAGCDVCKPTLPKDDAMRADLVTWLKEVVFGSDEIAAAQTSRPSLTWQALLAELNLSVQTYPELEQQLGHDLAAVAVDLETCGRPTFLARLKRAGIERLPERQQIASALSRASRGGRLRPQ
mmetsp:Transcript_4481/g.11812  ORF Transcript_4481/g.11812 Transcript_4481/m.11812 type:complete len:167 (-) Transcript_4481:324-824(-)